MLYIEECAAYEQQFVFLKWLPKHAGVTLAEHPHPRRHPREQAQGMFAEGPAAGVLKPPLFLSRSIFKPFIFVDDVKLVPKAQSPCFGDNDPARKEPRFQEKPDRRHELYKAHEWARAIIESDEVSLAVALGGWRGGLKRGRGIIGKPPASQPPGTQAPEPLLRLWWYLLHPVSRKPTKPSHCFRCCSRTQWAKSSSLSSTVDLGITEMCSSRRENCFSAVKNCLNASGPKKLPLMVTL